MQIELTQEAKADLEYWKNFRQIGFITKDRKAASFDLGKSEQSNW